MPEITQQPGLGDSKKAPTFARMADDSVAMAIHACELIGWRDLADDLQKVRQQTASRRRRIEREKAESTWHAGA